MSDKISMKLLFICFFTLLSVGLAQSQTPSPAVEPSWTVVPPKTEVGSAVQVEIRTARAQAFNDKHGRMRPLDQQGDTGTLSGVGPRVVDRFPTEPLPVRDSDAVVVATVTSYGSFLSADHTTVYTELYVSCDKMLKDSTSRLEIGSQITILKRGGALHQGTQTFKVPRVYDGSEPLEVGKRYVLFLKYNAALDSYADVDGWRLENNRATPLIYAQRVAIKTDNNLLMYSQLIEEQFLRTIQEKINLLPAASNK